VIVSGGSSVRVLLIYDPPFTYGNKEYEYFKSVLSDLGVSIVYKGAWEVKLLVDEVESPEVWVSGGGYSLVVVSWVREAYWDAVKEFVRACGRVGVSVLFLPGARSGFFEGFGFGMVPSLLSNESFTVVRHNLTRGVWAVGVDDFKVVYTFLPRQGFEWEPLVVSDGGGIVIVGRVGYSRAAAIAPYFYADDFYDNGVLFRNVLKWLLYMELGEEPEYGGWSSLVFKNLTEARLRLLEEVDGLRAERDRLLNETARLKAEIEALGNLTERLRELENETLVLKEKLKECESAQRALEESAVASEEVRLVYRLLGVAVGVGLAVGVVVDRFLFRRKFRGES